MADAAPDERAAAGPVRGALLTKRARSCLLLALGVAVLIGPAHGAPPDGDAIGGLWIDHRDNERQKVAVRIEPCDARLCGRIVWMKAPDTSTGEPKRDRRNPNAALRDRPLCGLTVLSGLRRTEENRWEGQIYNPGDGRTYSGSLSIDDEGVLRINGYVGLPLFGKTVTWIRPRELRMNCDARSAESGAL